MADARDRAIVATAAAYVAALGRQPEVVTACRARLGWLVHQRAVRAGAGVDLIDGRAPQVDEPWIFGAVARLVEAPSRSAELALTMAVAAYFEARGAEAIRSLQPGERAAEAMWLTGALVTDGEGEG